MTTTNQPPPTTTTKLPSLPELANKLKNDDLNGVLVCSFQAKARDGKCSSQAKTLNSKRSRSVLRSPRRALKVGRSIGPLRSVGRSVSNGRLVGRYLLKVMKCSSPAKACPNYCAWFAGWKCSFPAKACPNYVAWFAGCPSVSLTRSVGLRQRNPYEVLVPEVFFPSRGVS